MRKNSLLLIALALSLAGCGQSGPSHQQIQNKLASELPPSLKITTSESEFVPTTQDSGVVRIRAKLELTEDLFTQVPREATTKTSPYSNELGDVLKDAETQGVLIPTDSEKQLRLANENYLLKSNAAQMPVLKIADKQGTPFSFSGTSNATLEFKEWKLSPFVGTAPQITGLPRSSFPASSLMIGDPKISNAEDDAQKAFDNLIKAQQAHLTSVKDAIKNGKAAKVKAQKEQIIAALSACRNATGTAMQGAKQWAVESQFAFDENSNSITGWIFWPELKAKKAWQGSIQLDKDGMPFVSIKDVRFIQEGTPGAALLGVQYNLHPKEQGLSGNWEHSYNSGTIIFLPRQ